MFDKIALFIGRFILIVGGVILLLILFSFALTLLWRYTQGYWYAIKRLIPGLWISEEWWEEWLRAKRTASADDWQGDVKISRKGQFGKLDFRDCDTYNPAPGIVFVYIKKDKNKD